MIICYAFNKWKPGNVAPFAICDDCKRPESVDRDLARRLRLANYWKLKPVEQAGVRLIVTEGGENDD